MTCGLSFTILGQGTWTSFPPKSSWGVDTCPCKVEKEELEKEKEKQRITGERRGDEEDSAAGEEG